MTGLRRLCGLMFLGSDRQDGRSVSRTRVSFRSEFRGKNLSLRVVRLLYRRSNRESEELPRII